MLTVHPFHPSETDAVVALWERCGLTRPWNDPRKDIARKLRVQPEQFLVGLLHETVVATVMAGYEGHRGWINYLAVDPSYQRQGYGRQMLAAAEQSLRDLGCPKINLQVRSDNAAAVEFYQRLGMVRDDVLSFGKRLEQDGPAA